MKLSKPTKHLRPTADNREEAVDLILAGIEATSANFESNANRQLERIWDKLEKNGAGPLSVCSNLTMLFFYSMCRASGRIAIGDSGGWVEARRAFAALYWGLEIGQQAWLTEGVEYDQTTSAAKEFMSFHGLALAGGAGELAAWHAHFLRNLLSGGSVAGEVFEPDLIAFYTHIIDAHVTGNWPEVRDLSPELGAFRPLLEAVDDKDAFASALVRYCDFRLSRAYQFENTEARKPRRATDTMYVFEAQWLALFPFELCSLRGVYRAVCGKELSLSADHPLLHTPIMSVPALLPLVEDDLTTGLQAYAKRQFPDWRPLRNVPPIG